MLTPGTPLGLLTNAVQTLAGVLLPSATVFLLLLCNDKAVLGPWVNGRWLNLFTGAVIAVLVMLSVILTASVLFPEATNETVILAILGGGGSLGVLIALGTMLVRGGPGRQSPDVEAVHPNSRNNWRMPPLDKLPPARLSFAARIGRLSFAPISSWPAGSFWCGLRRWPLATTERADVPRALSLLVAPARPHSLLGMRTQAFFAATNRSLSE